MNTRRAKLLLDNCIPARFAKTLSGYDVETAVGIGWAALKDGELLDRMAGLFDVLISVDRSLPFQQRIHDRPLAVIILNAPTNRLGDLQPLVPELLRTLGEIAPGQVRYV